MAKIKISDINVHDLLHDIWDPLTPEQQEFLSKHTTLKVFKKNEIIYQENESPVNLMCLLTGKVKVFRGGLSGRNQIIRLIKPVEYFGYRAFFASEKYVNSAAAVESSIICTIPLTVISGLVKANNKLACFFIRNLSSMLGMADRRTVNLAQKHTRGKLAESLLFLKENYGLEEDNSTLSIYLSREDLANLSNMTTSNAIRTLSQFATEKLIAIDGRKIKLINEEELKKISSTG